jgi:hypothetical protein
MAVIIDGTDSIGDLGDALAAKSPSASPTFTGNVVWSAATLRTDTATVATNQTTTTAAYTDLATPGPAVTVTTGTKALVIFSAATYNSGVQTNRIGVAVSGATTVAASNAYSGAADTPSAGAASQVTQAFLLTGLTAGSNTFTLKFYTTGGTAAFATRFITVVDMGS